MKHFIFDLETFGTKVWENPVLYGAYAVFDDDRFLENPYSFDELINNVVRESKVSLKDQIDNYGCRYSKRDLEWWNTVDSDAKKRIRPRNDDLTVDEFCNKVIKYLNKRGPTKRWWCRGNNFDAPIITRLMYKSGNGEEWEKCVKYHELRDIRTFIESFIHKSTKFVPVKDEKTWNKVFVAHDASHDVAADILMIQALIRADNDLEMVEI